MGVLGNNYPLTPLLANPPGGQKFAPPVPLPSGSDPFTGTPSSLGQVNQPYWMASDRMLTMQPASDAPPDPVTRTLTMGAAYGMPELGIFAGPAAQTADKAAWEQAMTMARQGAHPTDIWNETGWFQGVDGMWRFEIPDNPMTVNRAPPPGSRDEGFNLVYNDHADALILAINAKKHGVRPEEIVKLFPGSVGRPAAPGALAVAKKFRDPEKLRAVIRMMDTMDPRQVAKPISRVVSHPDLWEAYPGLANRPFHEESPMKLGSMGILGGYSPGSDRFVINKTVAPGFEEEERSSLLHELQHGVQAREGFPRGSSVAAAGSEDLYRRNAGETEARNVQARRNMAVGERLAIPPWETMDVPAEQQIVPPGFAAQPTMTPEQFQRIVDYLRQTGGQ